MPSPTTTTKRPRAHIITRAEMARRLGITPSAVTQACRPGGVLHPALDGAGKGINVLHEAAQAYLARKASEQTDPIEVDALDAEDDTAETPTVSVSESTHETEAALGPWRAQVDLECLVEPLSTLTDRYGAAKEFTAWVKCRKTLEDALRAQMLRERVAGRLIARTTVVRMLEHVDVAFRLLLTDAPRTVATRIAPTDMAHTTAILRDAMEQIIDRARHGLMQSLEADDPLSPLLEVAAE